MTGHPKKPYVFVTCHRCGHRWPCTSGMEFVTCTSCRCKTKRIKPKVKETPVKETLESTQVVQSG